MEGRERPAYLPRDIIRTSDRIQGVCEPIVNNAGGEAIMSGLRFLVLGVGDAFSARYYSSCFAVEFEGRWLLIDCPHPIRKMMRDADRKSTRLNSSHVAL